eukprot:COSAG01_NODE_1946_length_8829_cov_909.234937_1_plen_182_part_10
MVSLPRQPARSCGACFWHPRKRHLQRKCVTTPAQRLAVCGSVNSMPVVSQLCTAGALIQEQEQASAQCRARKWAWSAAKECRLTPCNLTQAELAQLGRCECAPASVCARALADTSLRRYYGHDWKTAAHWRFRSMSIGMHACSVDDGDTAAMVVGDLLCQPAAVSRATFHARCDCFPLASCR